MQENLNYVSMSQTMNFVELLSNESKVTVCLLSLSLFVKWLKYI